MLKTREVIIAGFASKLEETLGQSIKDYEMQYQDYIDTLNGLCDETVIEFPEYKNKIDWVRCADTLLYFLAKWGALQWTDEKPK